MICFKDMFHQNMFKEEAGIKIPCLRVNFLSGLYTDYWPFQTLNNRTLVWTIVDMVLTKFLPDSPFG